MLMQGLRAEALKTKRTLALILTAVAPAVIVLMVFVFYMQNQEYYHPTEGINPWDQISQMTMVYWNMLLLPLFITLETALIAQVEHAHKNWKLIFTTPLSRWTIYVAKQLIVMAWIALSYLVLVALMAGAGKLLQVINPVYGLDAAITWWGILKIAGLSYLASWFMISFHLWVGTRWSSFVVAMGTGIAATVASIFVMGDKVASYFPWSIPGVLAMDTDTGVAWGVSLAICVVGSMIVALLGGWDVLRRDVV